MKIEFDDATIEAANSAWYRTTEGASEFFARFYADAANRQLEALMAQWVQDECDKEVAKMVGHNVEKPVFEVGKRYRSENGKSWLMTEHGGFHKAGGFIGVSEEGSRCSFGILGNFWEDEKSSYDLLPGAIDDESGQARSPEPLVEGTVTERDTRSVVDHSLPAAGGCRAISDEKLAVELSVVFSKPSGWLGVASRARELLTPGSSESYWQEKYSVWQARAEAAEAGKAKAEAALRRTENALNELRREGEYQMREVDGDDDEYSKGIRQGLLIALDAAGFTIIPAQPMKVVRRD